MGSEMCIRDSHVDANTRHRQDEPGKCTYQTQSELAEVFVRGFLVGNQSLSVHWDFLDLRDVMMLMRPDLEGRWILFVHHTYALEVPSFDRQGAELFLESSDELLAVFSLASSLEVIDVRAQNEYESL